MKKIALIMDGWKRFFTYAWPSGILSRLREKNEDVNLYIFNSFGDWSRDSEYNEGEYNIYNLPNFDDFDGIIFDINNIRYSDIALKLIEKAQKSCKPAISIANELEGLYYVGINNYKSMQMVIKHLYEVHKCKKYWFIMGPQDNYENNERTKALKDFMNFNNIKYEESDFFFESFEVSCGQKGFMKFYDEKGTLPDAVICANDNIAVGVIEAAAIRGYHVPDDFCVTGFDDFDKAMFYEPRITTVSHIREDVGYKCADILIKIWNNEKVDRFTYTDVKPIYLESCGCKCDAKISYIKHAKKKIMYDIETEDFDEQILALEYDLLNCKSIREISERILFCKPILKCESMFLVLDKHLNDFSKYNKDFNSYIINDNKFRTSGYPKEMVVEFSYDIDSGYSWQSNVIDALFPTFECEDRCSSFLFIPLHFRNYTVGYFVAKNAEYLMEKQYLFKLINTITSAMKNLYEKQKLEYMNHMLEEMSIKDSMTGLYNRTGFQKYAQALFDYKKIKKENLLIMFVDMDRLKYINDNYGHEQGDIAIKIIASAILDNCPDSAIAVRNGGDEFIIIQDKISVEVYDEFVINMRKDIAHKIKDNGLEYDVSFSIGSVYTDMSTEQTLDDYIRMADECMYEEKILKHVNR